MQTDKRECWNSNAFKSIHATLNNRFSRKSKFDDNIMRRQTLRSLMCEVLTMGKVFLSGPNGYSRSGNSRSGYWRSGNSRSVTKGPVTEGPVTEGPVSQGPVTPGPVTQGRYMKTKKVSKNDGNYCLHTLTTINGCLNPRNTDTYNSKNKNSNKNDNIYNDNNNMDTVSELCIYRIRLTLREVAITFIKRW